MVTREDNFKQQGNQTSYFFNFRHIYATANMTKFQFTILVIITTILQDFTLLKVVFPFTSLGNIENLDLLTNDSLDVCENINAFQTSLIVNFYNKLIRLRTAEWEQILLEVNSLMN